MKYIMILVLVILIPLMGFSSEDKKEEKNSGIVFFAMPFETPESGFGIGGTVVYFNNPHPEIKGSKLNETQFYAVGAKGASTALGLITERYYQVDKYRLYGSIEFDNWNDTFWGVGPNTTDDMEEEYKNNTFYINASFMRKIKDNLYLGPLYRYRKVIIKETNPIGLLLDSSVPGGKSNVSIGPGFVLVWDTRENTFYPYNGFWFETVGSTYQKALGSSYSYSKLELMYKQFVQIYKDNVVAFQLQTQFSTGSVPFQSLFLMGGDCMMRGIYKGRYMDKNHMAGQIEYRSAPIWRIGGVLFGSMAEVAPSLDAFNIDDIRYTWGTGLRFTLNKKEHINFRFDIGFDEDMNSSIYFTIKEAF